MKTRRSMLISFAGETWDETLLVQKVGESIGYGRTMQLCEQLWDEKDKGAAHATYCCTYFLVSCPGTAHERDESCPWCCGAGRVTKKVAEAICAQQGDR